MILVRGGSHKREMNDKKPRIASSMPRGFEKRAKDMSGSLWGAWGGLLLARDEGFMLRTHLR